MSLPAYIQRGLWINQLDIHVTQAGDNLRVLHLTWLLCRIIPSHLSIAICLRLAPLKAHLDVRRLLDAHTDTLGLYSVRNVSGVLNIDRSLKMSCANGPRAQGLFQSASCQKAYIRCGEILVVWDANWFSRSGFLSNSCEPSNRSFKSETR